MGLPKDKGKYVGNSYAIKGSVTTANNGNYTVSFVGE